MWGKGGQEKLGEPAAAACSCSSCSNQSSSPARGARRGRCRGRRRWRQRARGRCQFHSHQMAALFSQNHPSSPFSREKRGAKSGQIMRNTQRRERGDPRGQPPGRPRGAAGRAESECAAGQGGRAGEDQCVPPPLALLYFRFSSGSSQILLAAKSSGAVFV